MRGQRLRRFVTYVAAFSGLLCQAQVYSPVVLKKGQPDSTCLKEFAQAIYREADARTARERAEAIWRYFLTDGRFVKPGFWYHIAGWAYEEPSGEVLDPMKLLNSYGFGLCYHLAPLLEAVYQAGGFEDARVWFLTGHNVAEVFYDGQYHYFDSDMMGFNPVGPGSVKDARVASVHDIERDGDIILRKMKGPKEVGSSFTSSPWYPADVRAGAIGGLAELFTTTNDNRVYPFTRYPSGHRMSFTLRPGERMIRNYQPEAAGVYYLPYKFDGARWEEFPREIAEYQIRTEDGPKSQKDGRMWATGRIEYQPNLRAEVSGGSVFETNMPCPYVVIDAQFSMKADLASAAETLSVETSTDGGKTWTAGSSVSGPYSGLWSARPATLVKSDHGEKTAVSGSYGYRARLRLSGAKRELQSAIDDLVLTTRFQLNPRTLPQLGPGANELEYHGGDNQERVSLPILPDRLNDAGAVVRNAEYIPDHGQGYWRNTGAAAGTITIPVQIGGGAELSAFDAGGRFLDLRDGLAPDKLTAEVRKITPWPEPTEGAAEASLSWALTAEGPYTPLWTYDPKLAWKDNTPIDRTLRWPEVDSHVAQVPPGTKQVFVRYEFRGLAVDEFRIAGYRSAPARSSALRVTHVWKQDGLEKRHTELIRHTNEHIAYVVRIPKNAKIENEAIVYECPARRE